MPEETNLENPKSCLECGEPLGAGREDRKFCNDICRTAFNNRRRKEPAPTKISQPPLLDKENYSTRKVYQILLNNRQILESYMLFFGDQLELRDLIGRGFNLKYFTSEYLATDTGTYRFCFDHGYYIKGETAYLVFRPEEA
ncbi:MAG TPA: hypothetical protein VK668_14960 [Mucilaginibacter sp.]|nr:hypothetical protein [Mucilaginibacter sp.]